MLNRISCADREEWLANRIIGIGASESAATVGLSPWMTPLDLWKLKTGASKPKDLSGDEFVARGIRMEPAIRTMFHALHPEYEIEYHAYDILHQAERPWLFATLDGELTDESGRKGILEIKTSTPSGKAGWAQWSDGKLPSQYYTQVCHQLLATGYDFVILFAALWSMNGDITLRQYEIERTEIWDDMAWLLEKETEFWRHVEDGTAPPTILVL